MNHFRLTRVKQNEPFQELVFDIVLVEINNTKDQPLR